jgi:hypothetical protein
MVKHRRLSDNSESDSVLEENTEVKKQAISSENTPMNLKSILLSGTKYIYIIAAAALLSGIFTPLTIGVEIELVISGMLSLFLGLTGAILIFLGVKNQKFITILVCGGLGLILISTILIYEVAERSLF